MTRWDIEEHIISGGCLKRTPGTNLFCEKPNGHQDVHDSPRQLAQCEADYRAARAYAHPPTYRRLARADVDVWNAFEESLRPKI